MKELEVRVIPLAPYQIAEWLAILVRAAGLLALFVVAALLSIGFLR